jgi:hypothetical protein
MLEHINFWKDFETKAQHPERQVSSRLHCVGLDYSHSCVGCRMLQACAEHACCCRTTGTVRVQVVQHLSSQLSQLGAC